MKKKFGLKKILNIIFWLYIGVCGVLIVLVWFFPFQLARVEEFVLHGRDITNIKLDYNEYFIDRDYDVVQNVDKLFPKDLNELVNTVRTIVNSGVDRVSFYCNPKYKDCTKDFRNNYIKSNNFNSSFDLFSLDHPYNNPFNYISTIDNDSNKIEIEFKKKYTDKQIELINDEIDRLYKKLYDPSKSIRDNILTFNNYLVDTVVYDDARAEVVKNRTKNPKAKRDVAESDIAYGALFNKKAICSGYTDAMYLFLDKLGLNQVRIVNKSHTWNLVELDGKWYHLDVTWNDSKRKNRFFLVDTDTLKQLDQKSHTFNEDIWGEFIK